MRRKNSRSDDLGFQWVTFLETGEFFFSPPVCSLFPLISQGRLFSVISWSGYSVSIMMKQIVNRISIDESSMDKLWTTMRMIFWISEDIPTP